VSTVDDWLPAQLLRTERLVLEPLRVDHAEEMAPLLEDPGLHVFTGGNPATLAELRTGYELHLTGRSADGGRWLNWILRRREDGVAIGGLEATLIDRGHELVVELAWIIAARYQGRGYAREGAAAMAAWLRQHGAHTLIADIHQDHTASMAVARALGLSRTDAVFDDHIRWTG
jgi:RimJ/RimL family protein N-acetyltransferase